MCNCIHVARISVRVKHFSFVAVDFPKAKYFIQCLLCFSNQSVFNINQMEFVGCNRARALCRARPVLVNALWYTRVTDMTGNLS